MHIITDTLQQQADFELFAKNMVSKIITRDPRFSFKKKTKNLN